MSVRQTCVSCMSFSWDVAQLHEESSRRSCEQHDGMQGKCLPIFQCTSGSPFCIPRPPTLRPSNAASRRFPSVKGCGCTRLQTILWTEKIFSFGSARRFLKERVKSSLVFQGQHCSHVVLCSRLIECSWGNSPVDVLITSQLVFSPHPVIASFCIHCPSYAVFLQFQGTLTPLAYLPSSSRSLSYTYIRFSPSYFAVFFPPHTFPVEASVITH